MMKQFKTKAIVLRRTNYGEADRIINFITEDYGKIGAIAKGVRRPKSKMAGALEPFLEATVTFGVGRGELKIVLSTRLEIFYQNVVRDYDRLQFGYEAIKLIDKSTEEIIDAPFYNLLKNTFYYLNEPRINLSCIEIWLRMQCENLLGKMPDLAHDIEGSKLSEEKKYEYNPSERGLVESNFGSLSSDHIKFLRLAAKHSPIILQQVENGAELYDACTRMLKNVD